MHLTVVAILSIPGFALSRRIFTRQLSDSASFDWYALAASDEIQWSPCFDGQLCARLNLPLDYSRPDGPTTQIALQMLPATDKDNYQGSILVNPGGPGGPGTQWVLSDGANLASIFGPTFDILGFDPRGTGATTPLAQCFDSPEQTDGWTRTDPVVLRLNDGSIPYARAHDQLLGALCADRLNGTGREEIGANATAWGVGRFIDTASVATDMLHIAEKLGQEKLFFYGISYGTMIGQYFAALYPDKIERMIIDGVVDSWHWLRGQGADVIRDLRPVVDAFYADCSAAGRSKCPIWENTPRAVEQRVDRALDRLRKAPIALPDSVSGPSVFTEDIFLTLAFSDMYQPQSGFLDLATMARAVETDDRAFLSTLTLFESGVGQPPWLQVNEAFLGVSCSDAVPIMESVQEERADVRTALALAPRLGLAAAGEFSRVRISCANWPVRAKNRYPGPLSSTANVPILVVSNKFDPVTPLGAARNATELYPGMRLLVQNAVGHTAYLSLANCTAAAMRAYMTRSELPAIGTVCEPDLTPIIVEQPSISTLLNT